MESMERRAFTFVELIVVAAIICILFLIAMPNYLEAQTRAKVTRANYELIEIHQALETYRLDHRAYPLNDPEGRLRGRALEALTTPLAYMTHARRDIFTLVRNPEEHKSMKPQPYGYYNALQFKPEEGLELLEPNDAEIVGFIGGLVFSHGPAHLSNTDSSYTNIDQSEARAELLPYDATNGSVSTGDIYRRFP